METGTQKVYPLSGAIKCEACGWAYYGHTMSRKGSTYYYYTHRMEPNMMTGEQTCKAYSLPRDLLEEFVTREVKKALLNSDPGAQMVDYIKRYAEATTGDTGRKQKEY